MKRSIWMVAALLCVALGDTRPAAAGQRSIKNQEIVVNLTAPISTKISKAGDVFTAVVLEPAEFQGAIVEGHVRTVEPAKNMAAPRSRINFAFETMTVGDVTYKIQADLKEVANSKGVAKVDEEGQVIAKGNGGKRAAAAFGGAGLGSLAGGMLGGGMGSLIGAAAGGAAGYLISLDMTASSQNLEFYPGTHFTLDVTSKGVDKQVDASEVRKQEAANEAAIALRPDAEQAAQPSSPPPSAAPQH